MEGKTYYQTRSKEVLDSIEPLETFIARLLNFWDAMFKPSDGKQRLHVPNAADNGTASASSSSSSSGSQVPNEVSSSNGHHSSSGSILPSTPKDLTVLIVTHGGPVKVAFSALPNRRSNIVWNEEILKQATATKFAVWNCSVSEITMMKHKSGLRLHGDAGEVPSGWSGVINR